MLANHSVPSSAPRIDAKAKNVHSEQFTSSLADVCKLLQIPSARAAARTNLSFKQVPFKARQKIYTAGQQFDALYIVNSGFVKTSLPVNAVHEQVLGFPMRGDLLGTDGIHQRQYASNATALSHCNLIRVPFDVLRSLGKEFPEIELAMYNIMSRELMRDQGQLNMLGSQNSEVRVARFLLSMSARFSHLGYSDKEFKLRMTRQEIASYLGISLETVSRTLSAFHQLDFIAVDGRSITLRQAQKLKTLRRLPQGKGKTKERLLKDEDGVSSQSFMQMDMEGLPHHRTAHFREAFERPAA